LITNHDKKRIFNKEDYFDDFDDLKDSIASEDYFNDFLESPSREETASALQDSRKAEYDDKYILKRLMEGMTREEIAEELNHKNYRTLDMYMRRRGYKWDSNRMTYIHKSNEKTKYEPSPSTSKVHRVLSLFQAGLDPMDIAKKIGMKDHRTLAAYMKSKGYVWSSEKQTYVLLKGELQPEKANHSDDNNTQINKDDFDTNQLPTQELSSNNNNHSNDTKGFPPISRIEKLLPMLEMIERHKDKLIQLLAINEGNTIPRYVIGGVTITKSLCMSHTLSELIKEFSKEKNLSQREIFEVAIIEFLKKYGFENEVNSLFIS